jgi:transcriptional regulator with XRE-family HTH domain
MSVYKIFARNLREECSRFDSIAQLCRDSGINRQQFNKYLSGSTIPNARTLERLCTFLGIEDAQLFIRPEDKSALHDLRGIQTKSTPENLSLTKFLHAVNLKNRLPQFATPSSELVVGVYNCYFPLEGIPNFLMRSVLKTSVVGNEMRFIRHTRIKSPSSRSEHVAFGKHHGFVIDDSTSVVLLGRNIHSPNNISAIFIRKVPMFGLRIKTGLAFAQGVTTSFACRVCIESLGNSQVALKTALRESGIVAVTDPTVSKAVLNAMTQPVELNNGMLGLPSLEKILGLNAAS